MNKVLMVGRLAKEPTERRTTTGKAYTQFTIAVTRRSNKDEADFINCGCWDKLAENVAKYTSKGSMVGIEGRLQVTSYEKEGKKYWNTEVICDSVEFLSKKGEQEAKPSEQVLEVTEDLLPF